MSGNDDSEVCCNRIAPFPNFGAASRRVWRAWGCAAAFESAPQLEQRLFGDHVCAAAAPVATSHDRASKWRNSVGGAWAYSNLNS